MSNELTKYEAARHALTQAASFDEVMEIKNIAEQMALYAKQAQDTDLIDKAHKIKTRAERRAGQMLIEAAEKGQRATQKGNVNPGNKVSSDTTPSPVTLEEIGISRDQSSKWQKLASIPDEQFEKEISKGSTSSEILKSSNVHVSNNSGENEWYTPDYIIEAARLAMGTIDLDPASCELANKIVKAKKYYSLENNGLEQEWHGNVWLNPPYSQPDITFFSSKIIDEWPANSNQIIVLVNNATETEWFQRILKRCSAICFPKTRIKFIDKEGKASGAPLQGQAILYFGNNVSNFSYSFHDIGITFGPL